MGFMQKLGATIATKYGTVIEGKHAGCQVALGNDPKAKIETVDAFTQIIFLDGTDEKGRYDIEEYIEKLEVLGETEKGIKTDIFFTDGEHLVFELEWKSQKRDSAVAGIAKAFFGLKSTATATEEQIINESFRPIKVFSNTFCAKFTVDAADSLLRLFEKNNLLSLENARFLLDLYKKTGRLTDYSRDVFTRLIEEAKKGV